MVLQTKKGGIWFHEEVKPGTYGRVFITWSVCGGI